MHFPTLLLNEFSAGPDPQLSNFTKLHSNRILFLDFYIDPPLFATPQFESF